MKPLKEKDLPLTKKEIAHACATGIFFTAAFITTIICAEGDNRLEGFLAGMCLIFAWVLTSIGIESIPNYSQREKEKQCQRIQTNSTRRPRR